MEVNYVMILVAGIVSMIVGSIWYGPLFGKKWMEICGVSGTDEATMKQKQKEAMPLYAMQFLLSLLQVYILSHFVMAWTQDGGSGIETAIWIWLGFIMPTVAGSAMWNNNPTKLKWAMFLIQAGYQLVMFLIYGWMLGAF